MSKGNRHNNFFNDTMQGLCEAIEIAKGNNYNGVIDLESFMTDGRYTEPSDGKTFDVREMIKKRNELGRPLTDEEAEEFRIL